MVCGIHGEIIDRWTRLRRKKALRGLLLFGVLSLALGIAFLLPPILWLAVRALPRLARWVVLSDRYARPLAAIICTLLMAVWAVGLSKRKRGEPSTQEFWAEVGSPFYIERRSGKDVARIYEDV